MPTYRFSPESGSESSRSIATFGYGAFAIVALIAVRGDAQGCAERGEQPNNPAQVSL